MDDEPDSSFFSSFFSPGSSNEVISSKIQICAKYDDFYNLTHEKRGIALIFNHCYYDDRTHTQREGTEKDRDRLGQVFKNMDFEVRIYNDLKYGELYDVVKKVSVEDHSHNDCLVVCVMSHGDEGKIYAKDHPYNPDILWEQFTGESCQTLAGKPKLFFIQACRGNLVDDGTQMRSRVQTDSSSSYDDTYVIPTMADILVMYSTYNGYYSWRSPSSGSWFMQSLCNELEENGHKKDLLTLLTFVNRRVALDFKSNVIDNSKMNKKKQVCTIVSMLTRLMAFPKKRGIANMKCDK